MKGTPQFIACGNSARALQALRSAGAPVTAIDVLPDPQIRQELSALSGWPTIPQVFVGGELIGGADITEELAEDGRAERKLEKLGPDYRSDAPQGGHRLASGGSPFRPSEQRSRALGRRARPGSPDGSSSGDLRITVAAREKAASASRSGSARRVPSP
jgi:monothiol glutaredoxin